MRSIKEILMSRDGMSEQEAIELINEAKKQFNTYIKDGDLAYAEGICGEYFGLEPDYLDEIMF